MDGLECKRCKQDDTFDVLCDTCQAKVFCRTDRLIALSSNAKDRAESVCEKLGTETLQVLCTLDEEVTEQELVDAFNRHAFKNENRVEKYSLCMQLLKLEDAREGYAELAEISCRIFFDDNYLKSQIASEIAEPQDWKNQ